MGEGEEVEIGYSDARAIAKSFDSAQDSLEGNADTMPDSVEGGEGTDYIIGMLTLTGDALGRMSQIAAYGASSLRSGVHKFKGTDDEVAAKMTRMAKELKDD